MKELKSSPPIRQTTPVEPISTTVAQVLHSESLPAKDDPFSVSAIESTTPVEQSEQPPAIDTTSKVFSPEIQQNEPQLPVEVLFYSSLYMLYFY